MSGAPTSEHAKPRREDRARTRAATGAASTPVAKPAPLTNTGIDRSIVIGRGLRVVAGWSGRFILIAIAVAILLWLLSKAWVGVLPITLALIVATVLWPPVAWMRRRGLPPALAASAGLIGSILLIVGILASIAPSIIEQSQEVVDSASEGLDTVRDWVSGPPLELENEQIDQWLDQGVTFVQERASDIASGVFTGVAVVGSGVVTFVLVLVLTFFFLKDGPRFLPWVRRNAGRTAGRHLTEVLTRVWQTLGGFIRTQAVVSAVDAVLIGTGLLLLGVPLALALAVLTFFGGFIPIVGAFVAGSLAVLVALVSNSWQIALAVLALIVAVQQVEGNVLQPVLQSRSMKLHAAIILISVTAGGTLFGIVGAFLAVPVAASVVVVLRYLAEQVDLLAGDVVAEDVTVVTPEGALLVKQVEHDAGLLAEEVRSTRYADAAQAQAERRHQRSPARVSWWRRLLGRG